MTFAAINPEIRKGRKYDQVLTGARTVFLRDGFEGASVDDIAREAGVSKATLYSYFPDKRLLFMEMARTECQRCADQAMEQIDDSQPVEKVLRLAAQQIAGFVLSDFGLRIFRICVAESDRFPELGREFYRTGPLMVRGRIVDYLGCAVHDGKFAITDLELAADQFAELCKADLHARLLFGVTEKPTAAELDRIIDGAVAMFLARYGV